MKDLENSDDLIAKVLSGEASKDEIALLDAWKNASAQNADYFELSKKLFGEIDSLKITHPVNVNTAWNKLDGRIGDTETKVIPLYKRKVVLRAAASLILIMALAFVIKMVLENGQTQPLQYASANTTVLDTLPDGSRVFINKHSEISYVTKNNVRQVKLKGEAFFEVVHNEKQPFEIVIDDVVIKDIGTAFNVKAIPGTNTIEVIVESGEVQFFTTNDVGLNLIKGQKAIYNITAKEFVRGVLDPAANATSYRSKVFHFNGTALEEVIREINNVYDANIEINDDQLATKKLSVVFNNEPIETVINMIAETLDLEVEKKDSAVILKSRSDVK